jgi:hypothetical protein
MLVLASVVIKHVTLNEVKNPNMHLLSLIRAWRTISLSVQTHQQQPEASLRFARPRWGARACLHLPAHAQHVKLDDASNLIVAGRLQA